MNRFDVLEATVPQSTEPGGDRLKLGLLALLREASLSLDTLWRASLHDGSQGTAVELGEASHAVHRALIALTYSSFAA